MWNGEVEDVLEFGHLVARKLGAVAISAMVDQGRESAWTIGLAPDHHGGARTTNDRGDLDRRGVLAMELYRLKASTIGSSIGRVIDNQQSPDRSPVN